MKLLLKIFAFDRVYHLVELMGTQRLNFIGTHLFIHFLCGYMLQILCSLWALLCSCFFFAVGWTRRYLPRVHAVEGPQENEERSGFDALNEEKQLNSDDFRESRIDGEDSVLLKAAAGSKCEFSSGIDISRSVEEPETVRMSFAVEESCLGFREMNLDTVISEEADRDGKVQTCGEYAANMLNSGDEASSGVEEEQIEILLGKFDSGVDSEVDSVSSNFKFVFFTNGLLLDAVETPKNFSDAIFEEDSVAERREIYEEKSIGDESDSENKLLLKDEENFSSQNRTFTSENISEVESVDLDFKMDSLTEEGDLSSIDDSKIVEEIQESPISEANFQNFAENIDETEADLISDEHELSDDDSIEMKREDTKIIEPFDTHDESIEFGVEEEEEDQTFNDKGESDLWEHDDIIDQLKLELKNARTGGLPTILEEAESESESRSPMAMAASLKPLHTIIERKLEHKDQIMEIMKVYRSYTEKMRKLDVLNYQTMHAIGLLQLKDPYTSNQSQKPYIPPFKSLLSQNLVPQKIQKNKIGPSVRSMKSFYADLEMVYVGHVCLSWEILQWQYGKTRELLEFDSSNHHHYNQVANEFQLFQVLIQRFVENEPFQSGGPRIENYVNNRCVLRSLLQVPAVRDDTFIDKKHRAGAENVVSGANLLEILEESIRVLWDFVRTDKNEHNSIQKISKKPQIGLLDSDVDLNLLMDVKNHLHKKERYLQDIVRSGNCIIKRFKKQHDRVDKSVLFTQIEMKLISRVLNMRKLTRGQLAWCREKLDRTSIVSRKIYVEPSFLLFPC